MVLVVALTTFRLLSRSRGLATFAGCLVNVGFVALHGLDVASTMSPTTGDKGGALTIPRCHFI